MRFDNIASAANTPGGFQAGVNDIIQAIMGAKRDQAQQAFQQSQMAQQQANSDRSFGAEQAQRLASNGYRDRELKANELRAQTDQVHSQAQDLNMTMDNLGAVGKYFGDKFLPDASKTGGMTEYQKIQVERQKAEDTAKTDAELRSQARDLAGFSKEGLIHKPVKTPRMGPPGLNGSQHQMVLNGQPLWEDKVVDGMPEPKHWADLESQYQKLKDPAAWQAKEDAKNSQYRHEDMPPAPRAAGGTPGLGAQVAQSLVTQNTGDTNGLSQNELGAQNAEAQKKAELDYSADDLILQSKDRAYKVNRARPSFQYRAAIDANRAAGNLPKR